MADLSTLCNLYGGSLTSDAALVLKEEPPAHSTADADIPACKRRKVDEQGPAAIQQHTHVWFQAHRAVLWPLSEYFESKIKNWTNSGSEGGSSHCEISLLVPPGQLEIGKALIFTMYSQLPDSLTQPQLLQLLTLAESYKIDNVSRAVVTKFSSMPANQLSWETVLALLQLPAQDHLYQPARQAAKDRMLQLLGDLDIVWSLEQPEQKARLQQRWLGIEAAAVSKHIKLHELLLQLPFEQLLILLQDPEMRSSEDTLHYTVTRWIAQQSEVPPSHQEQLASLLLLDRCSPSYLVSEVICPNSWTSNFLSPAQAAQWTALSIAKQQKLGHLQQMAEQLLDITSPETRSKRSSRKESMLERLELDWTIPLADIQSAYNWCIENSEDCPAPIVQQGSFFRGHKFGLQLKMAVRAGRDIDPDQRGSLVYIQVVARTADTYVYYDCSYKAWKGGSRVALALHTTSGGMDDMALDKEGLLLLCDEGFYGDVADDFEPPLQQAPAVANRSMRNWGEIEHELRDQLQLVSDRGSIHVTAVISNVR